MATLAMAELSKRLKSIERELAAGSKIADAVRGAFVAAAQETFKAQADPYGEAWRPLQAPRKADTAAAVKRARQGKPVRGGKVLMKTGALRRSIVGMMTGPNRFVLQSLGYGLFHNVGTKHMPSRSFFPRNDSGIPNSWLQRASERVNRQFIIIMDGK